MAGLTGFDTTASQLNGVKPVFRRVNVAFLRVSETQSGKRGLKLPVTPLLLSVYLKIRLLVCHRCIWQNCNKTSKRHTIHSGYIQSHYASLGLFWEKCGSKMGHLHLRSAPSAGCVRRSALPTGFWRGEAWPIASRLTTFTAVEWICLVISGAICD